MLRTVEIIGGGLAGLSLGIGLRARGIPVRIVEAGTYPRHRVCGEFIAGLDEHTRSTLQLDELLQSARPATSVAWFEPDENPMRHRLPRPALCLSRFRLDAEMAEAFRTAGGDLRTAQRAATEPAEGRVMACGRRPLSSSRWIGLKQHFHDLQIVDDLEVHLGHRSYVGLTRVEGSTVNVCGLFPRPMAGESAALGDRIRAVGLPRLAERLAKADPVDGSECAVAGLDYTARGRVPAAIGDHIGLIPPFTGNGMTIALQSAAAALEQFEAWSRGVIDWSEAVTRVSRGLRQRFKRRLFAARLMHPCLLHPRPRQVAHALHRCGILPFGLLYRLSH